MTNEMPRFVYHGTSEWYYNLLKKNTTLRPFLQCWDDIRDGIGFAKKRGRQDNCDNVLVIIDCRKHDVQRSEFASNICLVHGNLDPHGFLGIFLEKDKDKYEKQYASLYEKAQRARELEDFLK